MSVSPPKADITGHHHLPHRAQSLAVDHLAVLRDWNIDGGPSLSVDELDSLRHRVGIFPAVLHGFEAQASAVPMRILRAFVGRRLRKSTGELHQKVLAGARSGLWGSSTVWVGSSLTRDRAIQ